ERVEAEHGIGTERSGGDPRVDVVAEDPALGQRAEPERGHDGDRERRPDEPGADHLHGRNGASPDEDVEEDARRGEEDDPPERGRRCHHRSVTSSSAFVVSRFRKSARMMARPTAASAAATVITKKTITCPSIEPRLRANATNVRLMAFSMSSIAMKMTMMFRRTSTPTVPIANTTALRPRYQVSGAPGGMSPLPAGEADRAHDGDEQQHGRELEGEHVRRQQPAGKRGRVAEALGESRGARWGHPTKRRGDQRRA